MEIKDVIRQRRQAMGLTLKEVADAVGVSEATVSRWESGDIANMKRDKIAALASVLHVSPSVIMGWEEPPAYYTNPDTARYAQEIFINPDMRILFDAARDSKPEDLRTAAALLRRFKESNPES